MSERFGLNEETIDAVCSVLATHAEVERAILFGSRAKGNYKRGSDIDLVLRGRHLNLDILNRIYGELDDLPIPYEFSLIIEEEITDSDIRAHVGRVGKIFYERKLATTG